MRKSLKVACWAVSWEPWGKKPRFEFFTTEKKARAFYRKIQSKASEQSIEKLPAPLVLGRRRMIAGVLFRSDGMGHWFSEDMRYVVFHMLRGTSWQQWELYLRGKNEDGKWNDCLELVETGVALADFKKLKFERKR